MVFPKLPAALIALAVLVALATPAQAGHVPWPYKPNDLTATPCNLGLRLTWSEPTWWGHYTQVGYQIDIATGDSYGAAEPPADEHADWWSLTTVDEAVTSYTLSGSILSTTSQRHILNDGVLYHLRVRAITQNPADEEGDYTPGGWRYVSGRPDASQGQCVTQNQGMGGTAAVTVSPSSLSVPIGARACYVLRTTTAPTESVSYSATSGSVTTATVSTVSTNDWYGSDNGVNYSKVGVTNCVKGVATGTTTITHTATSDDTNYNGITVPSVSVTVTAADSTPTVRFLHADVRAVEGSTSSDAPTLHDLDLKEVTVKLDVAPAVSTRTQIMWWIPHPDCNRVNGSSCIHEYSGDARYAVDYVATGLIGRQIWLRRGTNSAEFKFLIVADNDNEQDERVRMYLLPKHFTTSTGIVATSGVCVGGSCGSSIGMNLHIIDDDSDGNGNGGSGTEGDLGVFQRPPSENPQPLTPPEEEPPQQQQQNPHADLIAKVREWRNDARWVSYKAHTDRWDRVLLTLGETVSDSSLTAMTAAEAQGYADRGWTRWVEVAAALNALQ